MPPFLIAVFLLYVKWWRHIEVYGVRGHGCFSLHGGWLQLSWFFQFTWNGGRTKQYVDPMVGIWNVLATMQVTLQLFKNWSSSYWQNLMIWHFKWSLQSQPMNDLHMNLLFHLLRLNFRIWFFFWFNFFYQGFRVWSL